MKLRDLIYIIKKLHKIYPNSRYWPVVGPQVTLYVPRTVLECGSNQLIVLELERPNCGAAVSCPMTFATTPVINGTTPTSKEPALPMGRWDLES